MLLVIKTRVIRKEYKFVITVIVMVKFNYNSVSDETLITIRGLNRCRERKQIQEFARVVFVDNLANFSVNPEHARPMKKQPIYEAQDGPKVVS